MVEMAVATELARSFKPIERVARWGRESKKKRAAISAELVQGRRKKQLPMAVVVDLVMVVGEEKRNAK